MPIPETCEDKREIVTDINCELLKSIRIFSNKAFGIAKLEFHHEDENIQKNEIKSNCLVENLKRNEIKEFLATNKEVLDIDKKKAETSKNKTEFSRNKVMELEELKQEIVNKK